MNKWFQIPWNRKADMEKLKVMHSKCVSQSWVCCNGWIYKRDVIQPDPTIDNIYNFINRIGINQPISGDMCIIYDSLLASR